VVAIAVFAIMGTLNAIALPRHWTDSSSPDVLGALTATLTVAVNTLFVAAYLRRGPAATSDDGSTAWAVALAATVAPFAVPLLASGLVGATRSMLAAFVLASGLACMIWSLHALGSNFSLIPQARSVAADGPYRWVRHPVYTAEIIAVTGMCLAAGGLAPWTVLVALVTLQTMRARREEALLLRMLPGYAEYRRRTPMLVPWLR
jgi:protein-S-isoprenylcysteine O-methyltransferase Ste14